MNRVLRRNEGVKTLFNSFFTLFHAIPLIQLLGTAQGSKSSTADSEVSNLQKKEAKIFVRQQFQSKEC